MKRYFLHFLKALAVRPLPIKAMAIACALKFITHQHRIVLLKVIEQQPEDVREFLDQMHEIFDGQFVDEAQTIPKFVSPVNADSGEIEAYAQDNNSYHHTFAPICLLYPVTTDDVVKFTQLCNKYKIEITSYNKGTSLEGGVLPTSNRCAIINFSYMDKVLKFIPEDRQIIVQPGIGWMDLNKYLEPLGYFFPVDPGPGAGIGGMVGTCCSGTNAMKYGTMRNWVFELEVVLADGRVIQTGNRAKKSSAGYNLTQLMCGSEGTLGLITQITLQLAQLPKQSQVVTACFDSLEELSQAVETILKQELPIRCLELMDMNMVNVLIQRNRQLKTQSDQLRDNTNLLLLALNSDEHYMKQEIDKIKDIVTQYSGYNLQYAVNKYEADRLWQIRKQALWFVQQYGTQHRGKNAKVWTTDVCVPVSQLSKNISQTQDEINKAGVIGPIIGHVGDGNYHVTFVVDYQNQAEWTKIQAINHSMIQRAIQCGGTCTGEHGIGIGKRQYLEMERGNDQIELMRMIKKVFDPFGLLNPGKVFQMNSNIQDHLDSH